MIANQYNILWDLHLDVKIQGSLLDPIVFCTKDSAPHVKSNKSHK
jgi:ribosomal silencing factor RsfS